MNAVTADRGDFARALDLATSVVEKRNIIPILGTVKVVANGALRLEATDLDVFATVEIGYEGKAFEPFALDHPHKIAKALRHLGGDTVSLHEPVAVGEGKRARQQAQIASGQFDSRVSVLPGQDFPDLAVIGFEEFAVDLGADALAAIARVMPAISTEVTRYYLNGVCIDRVSDWTYRFVATDGHRLMIADVPLPGAVGVIPDRTIMPRRFLQTVMKHFAKAQGPVRMTYGRHRLDNGPGPDLAPEPTGLPLVGMAGRVGTASLALVSKLIDGTYPDYTRVIPKDSAHTLRVGRADLIQAIKGLVALADGKVRALKLEAVAGGVRLSLHSVDRGDASFLIPAEHALPPERLIAGFNGKYLLECLTALRGEEVQFDLEAAHHAAPTVIHDPADTAFRCVLMPMRV
jgi:DNA polymerase III subunit beta